MMNRHSARGELKEIEGLKKDEATSPIDYMDNRRAESHPHDAAVKGNITSDIVKSRSPEHPHKSVIDGKSKENAEKDNDAKVSEVHSLRMDRPHTKLSPIKAIQNLQNDGEDPYPSLSDYHDYEPNLEFDDSELISTSAAATQIEPLSVDYLESPVSDGTIEENFEEELARAPHVYPQVWNELETGLDASLEESYENPVESEAFSHLNGCGLVEVVGDDAVGRRVIVISACRLPSNKDIHHDDLLKYLMFTLDKYVEQDYSVVYFHHGLSSKNKPPLSWLWKAYKAFDRKYKKNLKALYLVHPTNFIRIVWQMLKPMISVKFGRKMMYVNHLFELRQHLNLDQICIPDVVLEHDNQLLAKSGKRGESSQTEEAKHNIDRKSTSTPIPTQQFGVSLNFIKENNPLMVESIPPIVAQCIEFLSQPDALETEGIFRRSANAALVKELQNICNKGDPISFNGDPHIAAVLLKTFLRELEEPLMTFDLYDEIIKFQTWTKEDRPRKVKILILEKLPMDNYKLLKYLVHFLWKVMDRSDLNKMTCNNLAVVFGPNLIWPANGQMSLQAIAPINTFTDFLLRHQETIFII